jgi:hypothetical protein
MLPPYVFFARDIDYCVMDGDSHDPPPYLITGSFSAEGMIETIKMGDLAFGRDSVGDATRFMFSCQVDIKGKSPFDIIFSCTDRYGNKDEKTFHFLASQPVETYTITLGAQNNSNCGFYFSFNDCKTCSLAEFENMKDDEGFCYGYSTSKNIPLLVSPTELAKQTIVAQTGNKVTSFCNIVAVDNVAFSKTMFDAISNDAFIRNLNGTEYGTFAFNQIDVGKTYLAKSSSGRRAIIYVSRIEHGVAGSAEIIIKLQKKPS